MTSGTLLLALMAIVLIVLTAGVLLMARGGEINRKYGNKLMIARVATQGSVVGLLLILFFTH